MHLVLLVRLPIEERACRKTDLGGGDYYLRNSGLPPSFGCVLELELYESGSKPQMAFGRNLGPGVAIVNTIDGS